MYNSLYNHLCSSELVKIQFKKLKNQKQLKIFAFLEEFTKKSLNSADNFVRFFGPYAENIYVDVCRKWNDAVCLCHVDFL